MSDEMLDNNILTFSENLADAKPVTPLPPGTYLATVTKAEACTSKNGNSMIRLSLSINANDIPPSYTDNDGEAVTVSTNIMSSDTKKDRYRIKKLLEHLGIPQDCKFVDLNQLVNRLCKIDIVSEEYDGELRNKVKAVKSAR